MGVRTNHRRETVYLYRLNTSADDARRLLRIYLARINELADRPEFYHLLSNSCTINIAARTPPAGKAATISATSSTAWSTATFTIRRVDTTLPFDELRRRSLINEAAQAADGAADELRRRSLINEAAQADGAPDFSSAFAQPRRRSARYPSSARSIAGRGGEARRPTGELTHDPAQFEYTFHLRAPLDPGVEG